MQARVAGGASSIMISNYKGEVGDLKIEETLASIATKFQVFSTKKGAEPHCD